MSTEQYSTDNKALAFAIGMNLLPRINLSILIPALPEIARNFAEPYSMALTIFTIYPIGLGLSQILFGPLSDKFGRKPVLLAGLFIALLGSLICIFSTKMAGLIAGRLLVGIGAGAPLVLSRICLRDELHSTQLIRSYSLMAMTTVAAPMISPVIGGWITHYFGFQAVLIFILILIVVYLLIYTVLFKETLAQPIKTSLAITLKNYNRLFSSRFFLTRAGGQWLTYILIILRYSLTPHILQQTLGLNAAQYGEVMLLPAIGTIFGGLLRRRYPNSKILTDIGGLSWAAGGLLLVFSPLSLPIVILAVFFEVLGTGLILPILISKLLIPYPNHAGAVSGACGSAQMLIGGLIGTIVVPMLPIQSATLALSYITLSIILFVLFKYWNCSKPTALL